MATTRQTLQRLRDFESRNVTFLEADGSWPIVWAQAKGVHVWDDTGKKYLDLTAAFGVTAAGHANAAVVRAGQKQMGTLLHAMGDVHPHALKAELAEKLSALTFGRWARGKKNRANCGKVIFGNSGFEAVEAALKTAVLATGRREIIAFHGAYHGLGYGALNVTARDHFRNPFRAQLREFGHFVPFPTTAKELPAVETALVKILRTKKIGAILLEPVQARGGLHIPPAQFLPRLRRLADAHGALLILDEIYTGFGRTGKWFACEHAGVVPDVICLGKALTGGFPLSACVGRADLMDAAWPISNGEAIHTSTYLGHPVGCAMALAQLGQIQKLNLPERSARLGKFLLKELQAAFSVPALRGLPLRFLPRGVGLMAGLEVRQADDKPATDLNLRVLKHLLADGYIFLPEGDHAEVLSFTPPLTISESQLRQSVRALQRAVQAESAASLR